MTATTNKGRRIFLIGSVTAATMLATSKFAQAEAAKVEESDPTAQSLGYRADATKVDKAKFPKYAAGQACGGCSLYQGKAGEAAGPCPIFAGKAVSAKGWCNAFVKKA